MSTAPERKSFFVEQGAEWVRRIRVVDVDLTGYTWELEIRPKFASTAAAAAESPVVTMSNGSGAITHMTLQSGSTVRDVIRLVMPSVSTVLLQNQDNDQTQPQYVGTLFGMPSGGDWRAYLHCDFYITPRATVV